MNEKKFEKEIFVCYLNVINLKCVWLGGGGLEILKKWLRRGGEGGLAIFLWLRSLWTAPKTTHINQSLPISFGSDNLYSTK